MADWLRSSKNLAAGLSKMVERIPEKEHGSDSSSVAELIRKKYLYRTLILKRKVPISRRAAARLIGPDCAYHLYRHERHGTGGTSESRS